MNIKKKVANAIESVKTLHYYLKRQGSKWGYRYSLHRSCREQDWKRLPQEKEREIKQYWSKYVSDFDIIYHQYYAGLTGTVDKRLIPSDIYFSAVDPYFNNRALHDGICDKNYFELYFGKNHMPKSIVHVVDGIFLDSDYRIIDQNRAIQLLKEHSSFVAKAAMGSFGGGSIVFFEKDYEDALNKYLSHVGKKNILFQETIRQHPALSRFNSNSINSIRFVTLLFQDKVYCLQAVLRMGKSGSRVDNATSGGIFVGIDIQTGRLKSFGFDFAHNRYDHHPDGFAFSGIEIPGFFAAVEMVSQFAEQMPHFRLINWDIAIDENETPILIEANLQMGDVDLVQPVNGPIFGELTDAVLKEVFLGK